MGRAESVCQHLVAVRRRQWSEGDNAVIGFARPRADKLRSVCTHQQDARASDVFEPTVNFFSDVLISVAGVNLERLLEQLDDGSISEGSPVGVTAAIQPGAVMVGKDLATLVQQAGFPQPGVANDRHRLPTSAPG